MEQIDMDKHVFCITAYKDFQQLSALLFRLTRGVADAMFIGASGHHRSPQKTPYGHLLR